MQLVHPQSSWKSLLYKKIPQSMCHTVGQDVVMITSHMKAVSCLFPISDGFTILPS